MIHFSGVGNEFTLGRGEERRRERNKLSIVYYVHMHFLLVVIILLKPKIESPRKCLIFQLFFFQ